MPTPMPCRVLLRVQSAENFDLSDVPAERYFSRDVHELEKERIWKRVWQFACREEAHPRGRRHRGLRHRRRSRSWWCGAGARRDQGVLQRLPAPRPPLRRRRPGGSASCGARSTASAGTSTGSSSGCRRLGLPARRRRAFGLPEVRVGTLGRLRLRQPRSRRGAARGLPRRPARRTSSDGSSRTATPRPTCSKLLPCNWKVAQEAFMESFHVVTTHPQVTDGDRRHELAVRRVRQPGAGPSRRAACRARTCARGPPSRRCSTR